MFWLIFQKSLTNAFEIFLFVQGAFILFYTNYEYNIVSGENLKISGRLNRKIYRV